MIKTKDGRSLSVRTLTVRDNTGVIDVNLWGEVAYTPGIDERSASVVVRNLVPKFDTFTKTLVVNVNSKDDFEVM